MIISGDVAPETTVVTLPEDPDSKYQIIQLNTIFITASVTAVIIILPLGILLFYTMHRHRKAVEELNRRSETVLVPMESPHHINEGVSGSATNTNIAMSSVGLALTDVTRKDLYHTLNDAIVSVHAYQSIGEVRIHSSQEGMIDMQRSNYEHLSRRNIVESENAYEQV